MFGIFLDRLAAHSITERQPMCVLKQQGVMRIDQLSRP
jgi:hypothetical protein